MTNRANLAIPRTYQMPANVSIISIVSPEFNCVPGVSGISQIHQAVEVMGGAERNKVIVNP